MTDAASTHIPRAEYPRPQWRRADWMTLNGRWQFEIDAADTGLERGLLGRDLTGSITVPYAPESQMSGVGNTDFLEAVWYRRTAQIPEEWRGRAVLLHFQAVDYDATVWVNGHEAGRHRGGSTPFEVDITAALDDERRAEIVVRARDSRTGVQPRGKQATWYQNSHCLYTRTTGIWQSVWLEPVGPAFLRRPRIVPDVSGSRFHVEARVAGPARGARLEVSLHDQDGTIDTQTVAAGADAASRITLEVPEGRRRLWSPGDPHLYDLRFALIGADGALLDEAWSYAGLRSVTVEGQRVLLNGEPVFQRLVLDQGYWPESLMTAPTDDALARDIDLSLAAGFNGARLHQKVFEERFLYHADRKGYLVWAEFPDWGSSGQGPRGDNQRPTPAYISEWLQVLERDRNHPSIVMWCPLNETHQVRHDRTTVLDDVTQGMFLAARAADGTRPIVDASGYSHRVPDADVWDSHDYEQDPARFAAHHAGLAQGEPFENRSADGQPYSIPYSGQPYLVSEYGGIWWNPAQAEASGRDIEESWGYGQRVAAPREFFDRLEGLTRVLVGNPLMFGYCYTQLTDVFQEQNGIYAFDRSPKFPIDRVHAIMSLPAAYEQTLPPEPDA